MALAKIGDADPDEEDDQAESAIPRHGGYFGGKWGVYLRAPDLWFRLMGEFRRRFVPLGEIADLRYGVKSGKDEFFFPKDCSKECLQKYADRFDFEEILGVPRKDVASGRVKLVRCGAGRGEIRPIEAEYLEPEVHSLMEIKGFTVSPEDCSRMILLVKKKKKELKGTYVLEYIKWGENSNWHNNATCVGRVSEGREWFDLTGHDRAAVLWPKGRQYRHVAPANPAGLIANCGLYEIYPQHRPEDVNFWAGLLNSSWVLLSALQYGRPVGNEGGWSTMVADANLMLLPKPERFTLSLMRPVGNAFEKMKGRQALQFLPERRMREMAWIQAGRGKELKDLSGLCELDMRDRRDLDDAVLQMIGVSSKKRRQEMINELYRYLRDFFDWTRLKEEKAIANKRIAKRRGSPSANEIAAQVYEEIVKNEPRLLWSYDRHFVDGDKPFSVFELLAEGVAETHADLLTPHGVLIRKGKKDEGVFVQTGFPFQDKLVVLVANSGVRGYIRFPREEEECRRVYREYERFLRTRNARLRELIEERTADEETQGKIYDALVTLVNRG